MPYSIMGVRFSWEMSFDFDEHKSLKGYHATLRRIAYVGKGERGKGTLIN